MIRIHAPWSRLAATVLFASLLAACDPAALEPPTRAPSAAPATPTPIPSFVRPTPTPQPTFLVHVVARGETLSSIADTYTTSAESIAYWNRARYPSLDPESTRYDPGLIKIGWTLVLIPFAEVDPEDLPPPSMAPTAAPPSDPVPSADPAPSETPA